MIGIRYEGKVGFFREAVLKEIRKAGLRGDKLSDPVACKRLQRALRRAQLKDLHAQILAGGGDAA